MTDHRAPSPPRPASHPPATLDRILIAAFFLLLWLPLIGAIETHAPAPEAGASVSPLAWNQTALRVAVADMETRAANHLDMRRTLSRALPGIEWLDASDAARRRREIESARAASRRILILGDSFLNEFPMNRSLAADIKRLAARHGVGVMNTAYGGFGPREYWDQMRAHAAGFRPDLVLLFYSAGNDVSDILYRTGETEPRRPPAWEPLMAWADQVDDAEQLDRPAEPPPPEPPAAPEANLPAPDDFDWERARAHGIPEDIIARVQDRLHHPFDFEPGRFVRPYFLTISLEGPRLVLDNLLIDTPAAEAAWAEIETRFGEIADLCSEIDADLCVVAMPASVQVDRSHYDFYGALKIELDDRLLATAEPQRRLREFTARRGVPFVDLLPPLRARPAAPYHYYWEMDDHFSEAGNVFAFEFLRDAFLQDWLDRGAVP